MYFIVYTQFSKKKRKIVMEAKVIFKIIKILYSEQEESSIRSTYQL